MERGGARAGGACQGTLAGDDGHGASGSRTQVGSAQARHGGRRPLSVQRRSTSGAPCDRPAGARRLPKPREAARACEHWNFRRGSARGEFLGQPTIGRPLGPMHAALAAYFDSRERAREAAAMQFERVSSSRHDRLKHVHLRARPAGSDSMPITADAAGVSECDWISEPSPAGSGRTGTTRVLGASSSRPDTGPGTSIHFATPSFNSRRPGTAPAAGAPSSA